MTDKAPPTHDATPGTTPPAATEDDRLHLAPAGDGDGGADADGAEAGRASTRGISAAGAGSSGSAETAAPGASGAGAADAPDGRRTEPATRVGPVVHVLDGARRVWRAPAILIGVWLVNLLLAVPFALAVRGALESHFGASLVAREAAQGFSLDWWGEVAARAEGILATFTASVIGFAAVLRNVSDLADARAPIAPLAAAIGLSLLAWTFAWGGILDRFARQRRTRAAGFFAACGAHFGRMFRLALMAGIVYLVLMRYVHPLLFDTLYGWMTHDLAVERTAFVLRLLLYALFGALFFSVHLLTDLARVRAVIEDRRSMIGAYLAGWRLLLARPAAVLGIYALSGFALVVWLALYALFAPGARASGVWVWVALLGGQIYLAGRLWLKLLIPAALIALYRAEVARGDLDLAPAPVWPESPDASDGVASGGVASTGVASTGVASGDVEASRI